MEKLEFNIDSSETFSQDFILKFNSFLFFISFPPKIFSFIGGCNMASSFALAFLSEKSDLLQQAKSKLERERPQNTHAAPSSNTKTYVSTKRVCK